MFDSIKNAFRDSGREFKELERLLADENRDARQIVFYSEGDIFYRYFEDYIEQIFALSDLKISYITSSPDDPVFALASDRFRPFYIKNSLNAAFSRLDSKLLIMTAPDINRGAIKRAPDPVHHIYAFHGISSIHQQYRHGAFDYYDSMLCIAKYQVDELRKIEELYNLKAKTLVETGYPLVDRIYKEHQQFEATQSDSRQPICLIAPTWGPSSIMEHCIYDLLKSLEATKFEVWVRPHPQYVRENTKSYKALCQYLEKKSNIKLQTKLSSMQVLHDADIMITDYSGIAFEYALGTERPVIFIDTPQRNDNPDRDKLGMRPKEDEYRDKLGTRIALANVKDAGQIATSFFDKRAEWKESLSAVRPELVANFGRSAIVGAEYIISLYKA